MSDFYSILDHNGRPIEKPSLLARMAQANVAGVRQAVGSGASRGLTPDRLARILREAEDGDPERYLELAEEMEEKDPHYLGVLGTRKRQVAQLDITVEAAGDGKDANDQANADLVNELNDSGAIDEALFDMLDAVGKGFSVTEIIWDFTATCWMPQKLEWVDPRFIDFDRATRRVPLLKGNAGQKEPLTPGKFLYLEIKAKSGIPLRGGIARAVAFNWMCKTFTVKDWIQFLEVYGMPVRIGKYPQGASDDDINALLRAISTIGSDAAGVIPQSMLIEFTKSDAQGTAGALFSGAADYFDKQTSKLVLGQTGTTDSTPGQLGNGSDHTEVRQDIEAADAKVLMACLNRQLIRPFIDLNRGPQARYPWLWIGRKETTDAQLMLTAAEKLVPMGARIPAKQILSACGFTEPEDGEEVLKPAAVSSGFSLPSFGSSGTGGTGLAHSADRSRAGLALLAAMAEDGDAISRAARENAGEWEEVMQPAVDQILAVLSSAKDHQDAMAKLQKLAPDLNMSALGERLARLNLQALAGAVQGDSL